MYATNDQLWKSFSELSDISEDTEENLCYSKATAKSRTEKPQWVAGDGLKISKEDMSLSVQVTLNKLSLVQTKYLIS